MEPQCFFHDATNNLQMYGLIQLIYDFSAKTFLPLSYTLNQQILLHI